MEKSLLFFYKLDFFGKVEKSTMGETEVDNLSECSYLVVIEAAARESVSCFGGGQQRMGHAAAVGQAGRQVTPNGGGSTMVVSGLPSM